ncbi:unnamed protein product [Ambrosiozyma monospora]|uniref:Unnamed protein product n=1 Tax=Ambrosiozyma monospora TaxID=43982 RepID=A0ACB5TC68_AMBMO|nr:unnamed protein product [Ambrosiozyma monospora]
MIVKTQIHHYDNKSPRQVLKHYQIAQTSHKNCVPIVFIHGGAWRDPTNTYKDFDKLVDQIDLELNNGDNTFISKDVLESKDCHMVDLYSIDYRLSPEVKHPDHLKDVFLALNYMAENLKVGEISLVGHSVGATLITQLSYRLNPELLKLFDNTFEWFLLPHFSQIMYLDGIYQIEDMVKEYPSYLSFVNEAFNTEDDYLNNCNDVKFNLDEAASDKCQRIYASVKNLYLIHSTRDELLSLRQPQLFYKYLTEEVGVEKSKISQLYLDLGKHNDVYQHPRVAKMIVDFLFSKQSRYVYD